MKWLRLVLALAVMVPVWAVLAAGVAFDRGVPSWWGLTVGPTVGVLFGLMFGENPRWRIWRAILGPDERPTGKERSRERYMKSG